jgi:drug/metabolite transporter (DMT)-like permease
MKNFALSLLFVALTAICWGVYGPVLRAGQELMGHSHWRPFICVGLAYFVIAILVPGAMLKVTGEKGSWTVGGTVWSLVAGAAGALGALGIILAFTNGGKPIYVMPLVFGCAPVVNTLYTMFTTKDHARPSPWFLAGLIIVATGAVLVLVSKPSVPPPAHIVEAQPAASPESQANMAQPVFAMLSVAMTALCWGIYGPMLHKGQMLMQGSRLRPLICVGVSYFVIAVVLPLLKMQVSAEHGEYTFQGTVWSLAGGAAGAIGALGVIMAFNFGGKPVYVMPLVFGCAPVISTFVSLWGQNVAEISPIFYAALILVVLGAVTVLVFAPRGGHKPEPKTVTPHSPAAGQPVST